MVAPIANMVEAALASMRWPPATRPEEAAQEEAAPENPCATGDRMGLHTEDVTEKEGSRGAGTDQDPPVASEPAGAGVCAPVLSAPGTRQHRVHRPPVRPGAGGCPPGLGGQRH